MFQDREIPCLCLALHKHLINRFMSHLVIDIEHGPSYVPLLSSRCMWKARHGKEAKKTSELSAKDHSYKEYLGTQVNI